MRQLPDRGNYKLYEFIAIYTRYWLGLETTQYEKWTYNRYKWQNKIAQWEQIQKKGRYFFIS